MDDDAVRTKSFAVVLILPGLGSGDFRLFGFIGIYHVEAVDLRLIAGNLFLGDGVLDLFAIPEFIQVREVPLPLILCCHGLRIDRFAVRQQVDRDLFRPPAVLVIMIFPGLHTGNVCLARCAAVGHIEAVDLGLIIRYRILRDRIDDFLTAGISGKILKAVAPAGPCGNGTAVGLFPIRQEADRDLFRSPPILIIMIFPGLGSADRLDHLRFMNIGHVHALHNRVISFDRIFGSHIGDLFAVRALRQIGKCPGPFSFYIRSYGLAPAFDFFSVRQQADSDALRTETVLIIVVIPGLGTGNIDLSGFMGIGDIEAVHGSFVFIDRFLSDRVFDLFTILELRNIREAVRPFAAFIRRNGLAVHRLAIGQQVHNDVLRAEAVLIIRILPGLGSGDLFDLLRLIRVGHVIAVHDRFIAVDCILGDGVFDLFPFRILRKIFKSPGPFSLLIRSYGLVLSFHFLVIRQKTDRDALRTSAVLIVRILPGLGAGDRFDLLRYIRIDDIEAFYFRLITLRCIFGDGIFDLLPICILR